MITWQKVSAWLNEEFGGAEIILNYLGGPNVVTGIVVRQMRQERQRSRGWSDVGQSQWMHMWTRASALSIPLPPKGALPLIWTLISCYLSLEPNLLLSALIKYPPPHPCLQRQSQSLPLGSGSQECQQKMNGVRCGNLLRKELAPDEICEQGWWDLGPVTNSR